MSGTRHNALTPRRVVHKSYANSITKAKHNPDHITLTVLNNKSY